MFWDGEGIGSQGGSHCASSAFGFASIFASGSLSSANRGELVFCKSGYPSGGSKGLFGSSCHVLNPTA